MLFSEIQSVKKTVELFNLRAKKSLGQNFIYDTNITDKLIRLSNIKNPKNIVEIGCGPGCLTRSIISIMPENFHIIEIDQRAIPVARQLKQHSPQNVNINIINIDALKADYKQIYNQFGKIDVISNLPYNIGTVLIFKWLENLNYFNSINVMLQKEVGLRMVANSDDSEYGKLSVIIGYLCDAEILNILPPSVFNPPPKVESCFIKLSPKKNVDQNLLPYLQKVTQTLFENRRKKIKKQLLKLHPDTQSLLHNTDVSENLRAENICIDDFVTIAKNYLSLVS